MIVRELSFMQSKGGMPSSRAVQPGPLIGWDHTFRCLRAEAINSADSFLLRARASRSQK
jgi:hypothetical protein